MIEHAPWPRAGTARRFASHRDKEQRQSILHAPVEREAYALREMEWKSVGEGLWALYDPTPGAPPVSSIVRRDGDLNDPAPKYCLAGGDEYGGLAEAQVWGEAALPEGSVQVEFRHGPSEGLRVVQSTPSHYVIVDMSEPSPSVTSTRALPPLPAPWYTSTTAHGKSTSSN